MGFVNSYRFGVDGPCAGVSYGSYNGTKAVYCDGANNFLRNASFSYDNSTTGFTILSMWYEDTATFTDFGYKLNIKQATSQDVFTQVGTTNIGARSPASLNATLTPVSSTSSPVYIATTYTPDGFGGSEAASYVNGTELFNATYAGNTYTNWNSGSLEFYMFRRNGGGARSIGYCGFMQILDVGIDPSCCEEWTNNAEPRNLTGSFNDVLLLNFDGEIFNDGGTDTIEDLSGNGYHMILDGFSAAQLNPADPAYCITNIP